MRRFGSGVAATALAVVLLSGCSGSGTDSGGDESTAGGGGEGAFEPGVAGDREGAPSSPEGADADAERQVVATATAVLAVEDPAEGARQVSDLVEAAGGRVDERTEQAGSLEQGRDATADLVVRVPADELTDVLDDLENLGDVASVSVSRSDVTATAVDLDARISALQTSVARLQTLMDGAADTEALLAAEQALSERQESLESLQSQRALLADQVELSTLYVHLEPFGLAPAGGSDGFADGLGTGWRALTAALGTALVVLGVVLPWLAAGALVVAAVLIPIRLARRRTTPPAPSVAPAAPPKPAPSVAAAAPPQQE